MTTPRQAVMGTLGESVKITWDDAITACGGRDGTMPVAAHLGEGATSIVYRGTLPAGVVRLQATPVAVKVLRLGGPILATQAERAMLLTAFTTELRALCNYRHANIVRLVAHVSDSAADRFALCYELCEGGTLAHRLRRSAGAGAVTAAPIVHAPLTATQRLEIAVGIARSLNYLHGLRDVSDDPLGAGQGTPCLHRDVKSANIGLTLELHAKLLDAGMAKAQSQANGTMHSFSRTGAAVGTPGYAPPEVADGEYGVSSEVYSFGIVLFELFSGQLVQRGTGSALRDEGANAIIQLADANVWPDRAKSELAALIADCLQTKRARRPQSMATVLTQLHACLLEVSKGSSTEATVFCDCLCQEQVSSKGSLACHHDGRHHVCSDCLPGLALHSADLETWRRLRGGVACPGRDPANPARACPAKPWSLDDFALLLDQATFAALASALNGVAQRLLHAEEARAKAEADREERLRAAQQAAVLAQKVERYRAALVLDVLALRCPGCKALWADYDGCDAVQCAVCRCHFCALCLETYKRGARGDADTHAHLVARHGGYWNREQFGPAQAERFTRLLADALRSLPEPPDVRRAVLDALVAHRDLADVRPMPLEPGAVLAASGLRDVRPAVVDAGAPGARVWGDGRGAAGDAGAARVWGGFPAPVDAAGGALARDEGWGVGNRGGARAPANALELEVDIEDAIAWASLEAARRQAAGGRAPAPQPAAQAVRVPPRNAFFERVFGLFRIGPN